MADSLGVDAPAADSTRVEQPESMVVYGDQPLSYSLSTTTLEAADFTAHYGDVGSLLTTVAGVTIFKTGGLGAYSDMSIRGSGSNQVQVFLDGMPLNTAAGGAVDLSKIPLGSIQKVTVHKTTAPLALSGQNAGGVVELTTAPGYAPRIVTATAEAGSYGYRKAGSLIALSGEHYSHRLSIDYAHSDNDYPYTYDATPSQQGDEQRKEIDNHEFTALHALYAAKLYLDSTRHSLGAQLSTQYTHNGLFSYATPNSNDGFSEDRLIAAVANYWGVLSDKITLEAVVGGQFKQNLYQRQKPFYLGSAAKRQSDYPGVRATVLTQVQLTPRLGLSLLGGASHDGFAEQDLWQQADSVKPWFGRQTLQGAAEIDYGMDERFFARLKGTLLYQRDSTNGQSFFRQVTIPQPQSTHQYAPSVQAEMRFHPSRPLALSLCATYAKRTPSLTERFGRTVQSYGSETLLPETRMELEMGMQLSGSWVRSTLAAYVSTTRDKIKWIGVSQNIFVPRNIETVQGQGVEWEITLVPTRWLMAQNSLGYMRNTIVSAVPYWDGNDEPLLPRFKQRSEVRLSLSKWTLGHTQSYSSRYYLGPHNRQFIEPGLECGGYVSFTGLKFCTFTYRLENYLKSVDFSAGGAESFERLPKPGRMHYLSLNFSL
jgi:outer membrane cobalamin receptor